MQSVLIVLQLMVAVALVIVILLQRYEGGALGMGGGGAGLGGLFSPRGAADTLTRTTAILALLFIVFSLALTVLAQHSHPQSILDTAAPASTQPIQFPKPAQQPAGPAAPAVPTPHG